MLRRYLVARLTARILTVTVSAVDHTDCHTDLGSIHCGASTQNSAGCEPWPNLYNQTFTQVGISANQKSIGQLSSADSKVVPGTYSRHKWHRCHPGPRSRARLSPDVASLGQPTHLVTTY